ncbi:MAG: M48 family metallopeptidase [Candidatus Omnitrophica bacterium]|nr:M48 family metallopeptidase [Candidatus Omnitrophota bacterium]
MSNQQNKAKRYSSTKYALSIVETVYLFCLLLIFLNTGLSKTTASWISRNIPARNLFIPSYLFVISFVYYLFELPLNFYRSYILEHKFSLSTQKITSWFKDQIKAWTLLFIIALILVLAFYYILERYPKIWWLVISFFWIFFNLILSKLTPTLIIPLFFKYKKLSDEILRRRILDLADKMKVKILDCFEIDFSKKTLKANAAFVGWGATKRVILADTLKDKYSYDEIEVILAHEFAHYKLRHLLKLIFVNSVAIILAFYLIFRTSGYFLGLYGFFSIADIAALPLIILYFLLFGILMQPFENYVSRMMERNADAAALKITKLKEAFISMMDKLAAQNLADRTPHPIIKFFFFDHPPVDERIAMAAGFAGNPQ